MSRINTNVTALISARVLNQNTVQLNKSLERLSTGLRINRGADDPAGLIASENLRKQVAGRYLKRRRGGLEHCYDDILDRVPGLMRIAIGCNGFAPLIEADAVLFFIKSGQFCLHSAVGDMHIQIVSFFSVS